jgi:RNA polymerase sigma factor (sigma-70 family)
MDFYINYVYILGDDDMLDNSELCNLLNRIKSGDKDALTELWYITKDGVYTFIYSIFYDKQLAEDVVQETFISIYNNARHFEKNDNAKAWIYTIARNNAITMLRKKTFTILNEETLEQVPSKADMINNINNKIDLNSMLSCLNEVERSIIILHVVIGLKHYEIAKILSLPLGTIYRKYSTSIKKIKKQVKFANYYEWSD